MRIYVNEVACFTQIKFEIQKNVLRELKTTFIVKKYIFVD